MNRLHRVLASAAIGILVIACSTSTAPVTPSGSPVAGPSATPSAPPPAPSASPSTPAVSAPPTQAPPTEAPPTKAPPVVTPKPSSAPTYSAAERRLLEAIRVDARIGCAPRRTGLPQDAVAGVECRVGSSLVDRVGIYSFKEEIAPDAALQAYLMRLVDNGVTPRTGDCLAGSPGDSSWPSYLPDEDEDLGYRLERSGCFFDENGIANVRLTCYDSLYVGILGKNADLASLYKWAWRVAAGEITHRDPPGICAAPD